MVTFIRLNPEIERPYERLGRETHRTKSLHLREADEEGIDRMEFEYRVLHTSEEVRSGRMKTFSLEEVGKILELEN